jgi:SAM-dependent methyltransferase
LNIPEDFDGTILDFGCGLGDAIPIYRQAFPKAKFIGMDISQTAIDKCHDSFGSMATFMQGDYKDTPEVDIIISSNVFEHLSNDREIAKHLLTKCRSLNIIVPYREYPLCSEHINSYEKEYFNEIGHSDCQVFPCKGWTPYGLRALYYNIYFKNIFRFLLGKPVIRRNMQIIYRFLGTGPDNH